MGSQCFGGVPQVADAGHFQHMDTWTPRLHSCSQSRKCSAGRAWFSCTHSGTACCENFQVDTGTVRVVCLCVSNTSCLVGSLLQASNFLCAAGVRPFPIAFRARVLASQASRSCRHLSTTMSMHGRTQVGSGIGSAAGSACVASFYGVLMGFVPQGLRV